MRLFMCRYRAAGAVLLVAFFSSLAYLVFAADLNWEAATNVSIGSATYTIAAGSTATSLIVGTTTLTVTVPSGSTFTLISADRYQLSSSDGTTEICSDTQNLIAVTGPKTSAVITPTTTICTPAGRSGDSIAPGAPTGIGVLATSSTVTLTWTDPTDQDFASIDVLRNIPPSTAVSGSPLATITKGIRRYVDTSVSASTAYTYILRSKDSTGNVRSSDLVTVTTIALAPAGSGSDGALTSTTPTTTITTLGPITPTTSVTTPATTPSTPAASAEGTVTSATPTAPALPAAIAKIEAPTSITAVLASRARSSGGGTTPPTPAAYIIKQSEQLVAEVVPTAQLENASEETRTAIETFVAVGPENASTQDACVDIGLGERASLIEAFRLTQGRLPTSDRDYQYICSLITQPGQYLDPVKAFPEYRNLGEERNALKNFVNFFGRLPSRNKDGSPASGDITEQDWWAVKYMAYHLKKETATREVRVERICLRGFVSSGLTLYKGTAQVRKVKGQAPRDIWDWDFVRACAYSGVPFIDRFASR